MTIEKMHWKDQVIARRFDFAEEDWILALINLFSRREQENMKMPITYKVEIIHVKANSILKT